MPSQRSRTALVARLVPLGLLAVACAIGSAYAANRRTPTAPPRHRTAPGPLGVASPIVRVRATCAGRRARALAAMVAPDTTVRLAAPPRMQPPLHQRGYVFPVLSQFIVVDTFGAARDGVSWHHGDDLFAPKGTPVLAVSDGVVFSVGEQRLGGRRLWLRDHSGNEFYYAHLNAYSRLARNGEEVGVGDVVGYVGNSGDAERTPSHLHFEIHPASLLGLGYDGAVDPTAYLRSWRKLTAPVRAAHRPARCSR
jgi:murein DD-endopeptidase MepM/ murein hydrolase activator NlpD